MKLIVLTISCALSACSALSTNSSNALNTIRLGDEAYERRDYGKAVYHYGKLLQEKEFQSLDQTTKFYLLDRLASSLIEQKQFSKAEDVYRKKIEVIEAPDFRNPLLASLIYEQVAIVYANTKTCNEARALFEKAMEQQKIAGANAEVLDESTYTFNSILKIKGCSI